MICASPADYNAAETVSALNFAMRCKDVKNAVGGGAAQMQAQLAALKAELAKAKGGGGGKRGRNRPAIDLH